MMKSLTLVASSLLSASLLLHADHHATKVPAEPEGMKAIFNGKDLTGWDGDPRLWEVKEGVIRGETTEEKKSKGNTFLIWKEGGTKDFDLRLSFRVSSVNNSGIQYRSKHIDPEKANNAWVVRGYQHEIRNSDDMPNVAGFIYDEGGKRGRMALAGDKTVWGEDGKKEIVGKVIDPAGFAEVFKVDDWNEVAIIAKGNHIQHFMNGRLIMDCTDKHPERALLDGVLALQLHGGAPMWCEFKDVRIKELK